MARYALAFLSVAVIFSINCGESLPTAPSALSDGVNNTNNPLSQTVEALGEVIGVAAPSGIPQRINGVELRTIRGWHANMYPWAYDPRDAGVHPVPHLWSPGLPPSPLQVAEQCRQIRESGGGAAVLEYNVETDHPDHNFWLSNNFAGGCGLFFILYEHIYGTRFNPRDGGPKNMNDPHNRRAFKENIDFIFRKIVLPNQSRYVTVGSRAVIYMWATGQMAGDFAGLLEEVKSEYPVFFIGSEGMGWIPEEEEDIKRFQALDGFMDYSLGGSSNYLKAVQGYRQGAFNFRQFLRKVESKTGKKHLLIPTFQAAYDDTKVAGRNNPPLYAKTREEVEYHADLILSAMGTVFDNIGPFVVHSELPEGAAVIESQCRPDTLDRPGRFYGCGMARLEILKKFFGR